MSPVTVVKVRRNWLGKGWRCWHVQSEWTWYCWTEEGARRKGFREYEKATRWRRYK